VPEATLSASRRRHEEAARWTVRPLAAPIGAIGRRLSFPKFHPAWIHIVRQNHRIDLDRSLRYFTRSEYLLLTCQNRGAVISHLESGKRVIGCAVLQESGSFNIPASDFR
jgi:hypothetical protein